MKHSILTFLFLLFLFLRIGHAQSSWLPMNFTINEYNPRVLYGDTTDGWLYVGGSLQTVNGKRVNRMFRVDSLGQIDFMDTVNPNVQTPLSMVKYKDTLFTFGASGMFKYENSIWKGRFKNHVFYSAYVYKNELLISGYFKNAISKHDGMVIRYDGSNYYPFDSIYDLLGDTVNFGGGAIYTMLEYKGNLYLGGNVGSGPNDQYNEIMSWDGTSFGNMQGGIKGNSGFESVGDLIIYKNELYVSGTFRSETGSMSNNILKWDGNQWYALGDGIYGSGVSDMEIYKDELWVFGDLDSVQGLSLSNVAIWNGNNWCSPGGEIDNTVFCSVVYRDTLYIGGNFGHIDNDIKYKGMAKYNRDAPRKCGPKVNVKPVGIEYKQNQEKSVIVYPNPTTGKLKIKIPNATSAHIQLFNINGKLVLNEKLDPSSSPLVELNLGLNEGIYLLKIELDDTIVTKKIVIE